MKLKEVVDKIYLNLKRLHLTTDDIRSNQDNYQKNRKVKKRLIILGWFYLLFINRKKEILLLKIQLKNIQNDSW